MRPGTLSLGRLLDGVFQLRWIVAAIILLLLAASIAGDGSILHFWRLRSEVQDLARDVRALEAENERLSREIADLRDNPAVIERLAREELGLVRPGERVLRFPKAPRSAGPPGITTTSPRAP